MRALLAAALLLLMPGAAEAQTHADSLRLVARDAFTLLQVELGTGRFTLDETTVTGMSIESVIISASGTTTPAQWEADVRAQLAAKMKALAAKVAFRWSAWLPSRRRTGWSSAMLGGAWRWRSSPASSRE